MIISRTPFRISFAGGGSDFSDYYLKYGGCVLSASINKYVYLSMHPFFYENKFFLKYSKTEHVDNVNDIEHNIIREVFKDYAIQGVDFNSSADIPSGTGLGSSSAFTSGLIMLCNAYTGKYMTNEEIAAQASNIEINRLGEPIGKQDQYACAIGGLNYISFNQDDSVTVERMFLNKDYSKQLQNRLLMFYTGTTRSAGSILIEQKKNISIDNRKIDFLHKMVKLAGDLRKELYAGRIDSIGEILHSGWKYKKEMASGVSNSNIDTLYNIAMENGAEGGKLLGAGGGGFLLFYIKEENQFKVRNALKGLYEFKFEFDTLGTNIVYYN